MTPAPPLATDAPAALTAVLREVAPRATVLAEMLCGDPRQAEAALADAVEDLGSELQQGPVQDWVRRFWTLVLTAASLRAARQDNPGADAVPALAPLSIGLRAVVLLRLVARLDDPEAAHALGIPLGLQRRALQRALPRDSQGGVDLAAWQSLRVTCERRLRQGPDPRKGRLDRLFALATQPSRQRAKLGRGWQRALWIALAACALTLVGSFVLRPLGSGWYQSEPAQAIPLPPAAAPASTFDAQTAVLAHPDFDMLAAPPQQLALVDDLAFYSWYAAQLAARSEGSPLLFPDAGAPVPADATANAPH
jgi:hypothetical protein